MMIQRLKISSARMCDEAGAVSPILCASFAGAEGIEVFVAEAGEPGFDGRDVIEVWLGDESRNAIEKILPGFEAIDHAVVIGDAEGGFLDAGIVGDLSRGRSCGCGHDGVTGGRYLFRKGISGASYRERG